MHYLVDAYNFLFCLQKGAPSLEKSRERLIEHLNEAAHLLHLALTLVFDGAERQLSYPLRGHFDALALVYTPEHQTADEYIIQEITEARHPRQITLISNDKELSHKCRLLRAHTLTIHEFVSFLIKKEKKGRSPRTSYNETSGELARLLDIFEKRAKEQANPPKYEPEP